MTASELSSALQPVFDNWYNNLKKHQQAGSLSSPLTIYCQDSIQLYETEAYFALELTGATPLKDFQTVSFNKKVKKLASLHSLVNAGSVVRTDHQLPAQLTIQNPNEVWANLCVASHDVYDAAQQQLRPEQLQAALQKPPALPLAVQENVGGLLLANALTLRLAPPKLHLRALSFVLVLGKQTDPIRLVHFVIARLNETFPKRDHIIGIFDKEIEQQLVAQLQKADTKTLQTLLAEQGNQLAQALGYQSAKSGVVLKDSPQGSVDLLLERASGTYDLLQLSSALYLQQMGKGKKSKGKKSKPSLSAQVLALKTQLAFYQAQAEQLNRDYGVQLAERPLLIAVVNDSKQVYQQALNQEAQTTAGDVVLLTFDALAQLEDRWLKKS
jgi:hypothetical protein